MISVFGDESSSTFHATYGLLAIVDRQLPELERIVTSTRRFLKVSTTEPLHARVLFHLNRRQKSTYKDSSLDDVQKACMVLLKQVAALDVAFYFGRVDRKKVPKVLHVPLIDGKNRENIFDARLKLELAHLQLFAYAAAATRACHVLPGPVNRLIVDRNRSVVRWFNENRQASRLMELFAIDATLPQWPVATMGDDGEFVGLQIADILTYYATKQFYDPRFACPFDVLRAKTTFMVHEFDSQTFQPYVAPPGVTVSPFPKKG